MSPGRLTSLSQHPTRLRAVLLGRDATDLYICGLATDVCVGGPSHASSL
jgi:nicotinamidase-related amidase